MARGRKYKSKSDYSLLKNKHQLVSEGTIFESDHMTISKMDEYFSTQVPVYSDSNFKFSVRPGSKETRRHMRWGWVCPDMSGDTESCQWTLLNMPDAGQQEESHATPNADYTTMRSFAYYGSAVDLVKSTINAIAAEFPAELYFSQETENIDTGAVDEDGASIFKTYYVVSNPYEIDTHSKQISASEVENTLRYFCLDVENYVLLYDDGSYIKLSDFSEPWSSTILPATCQEKKQDDGAEIAIVKLADGSIELRVRYIDGRLVLLYEDENLVGLHIRPNNDIIEKYFNEIDIFTSVLLNRASKPLYTSRFNTVTFTDEDGYQNKIQAYTWPSVGGFNPDVSPYGGFRTYLAQLIEIATYHDTHDSDNIWRIMTHESIKNLDWTFSSDQRNKIDEFTPLDATKIEAMCKLYGRQYDDLKLYTDSIKFTNNVTYNKRNNLPDYSLSDLLSSNGWNVRNLNYFCKDIVRTSPLYPSESKGYNPSEASIEFMRRLLLNTRYIYSLKGTRLGIEALMALFGFDRDEYELYETVGVASPKDVSYIVIDSASEVSKLSSFVNSEFSRFTHGDLSDAQGNTYFCWRKVKYGEPYYVFTKQPYSGETTDEISFYYRVENTENNNIVLNYAGKCHMFYDFDLIQETEDMTYKYPPLSVVEKYNKRKDSYYYKAENSKDTMPLEGIYANYVYQEGEDGADLSYVIPWCEKKDRHDGGVFFQSKGGWWNEGKRLIDLEAFPSVKKLISTPGDNFGLYDETHPIVKFADTLADLIDYTPENLITGDICYVTNISAIRQSYVAKDSEESDRIFNDEASHYFILKNKALSSTLGFYTSDEEDTVQSQYGWRAIMNYELEIDTLTTDGKKVIYAESIRKETTGNNPHIGSGIYDQGDEYKDETARLFNWSINNDNFTTLDEHEYGQADRLGFNLQDVVDNRKCWYFNDENDENKLIEVVNGEPVATGNVKIGRDADSNYASGYTGESNLSELFTYNPEKGDADSGETVDNSESAANSIVNLKNVEFVFKPKKFIDESNRFFDETILPYLTALVPSTVITKVSFGESDYAGMTSDEPTTIGNDTCPRIIINEEEIDGTISCVCK